MTPEREIEDERRRLYLDNAATPDQIAALEAENERLAARIAEFNADDASLRDAFMAVRNRGGMPPTEEQIIAAYRKGLLMYRGAATPAAPEALDVERLARAMYINRTGEWPPTDGIKPGSGAQLFASVHERAVDIAAEYARLAALSETSA